MITIVKRPVITEKSLMRASRGWYTFAVDIDASKPEIARAVNVAYTVNVTSVRTQTMHGKQRRVGKKMKTIQKSDWKKALVHLKEGQTIPVFEVAPEEGKK